MSTRVAEAPVVISQKDNFAGNFGLVYRSSAIFYYRRSPQIRTTISFMDYWSVKRSIDVMIVATTRSMAGELVRREPLVFDDAMVINYRPDVGDDFEGSVEIEVFAGNNMVIPYSAIMAVYEAPGSLSMVHSYGRTYSPHEIEEGRTICVGEESGWTVRDTDEVRSFAVFHNGLFEQPAQTARMVVTNARQERREVSFELPTLPPFATHRVVPAEHDPEIGAFLGGEPGNVSLSFRLGGGFTRMLVGNETIDGDEIQVTHSNFNYSRHVTDTVDAENQVAYMVLPEAEFRDLHVVVYPDCSEGSYTMTRIPAGADPDGSHETAFLSGQRVEAPVSAGVLEFRKTDGTLPSRIVTALNARPATSHCRLPFECSLGVVHAARPLKSSFWALVADGRRYRSRIIVESMECVYGPMGETGFRIGYYSPRTREALIREFEGEKIRQLSRGVYVDEIFPELAANPADDFGYVFMKSTKYGGFIAYTTIESEEGSLSMEHTF